MSQNLIQDKKTKYKVVKILGTQTNATDNTLKVIKLVRVKKPSKIKMPEFISLDDDDEKVIKIDDSDDENVSSVPQNEEKNSSEEIVPLSFGDLVQNNTSNGSKLIIASVTSARPKTQQTSLEKSQILPNSTPVVISITTDGANNANIHEEIEKVKKCFSEKSTNSECLEISDSSQNSFQIENIQAESSSNDSDNENLLVEIKSLRNSDSKTLKKVLMNNIPKYSEGCAKKVEISRPKRNRKVPKRFSEGENCKPLNEIYTSTSIPPKSLKRKNLDKETEKPQKKSGKRITMEKPQVEEFRDADKIDTEANTSILRNLLLHPKLSTSLQSNRNIQKNYTKTSIPDANSVKQIEENAKKSKRFANQDAMKNKSTDQPESSQTPNLNEINSEEIKLNQADHIYISVKQDPKELSKHFDLSKIEIRRFALNITKIDYRKYISASEPNSPNLSPDLEHQLSRNSSDPNLAKKSENEDQKIKNISRRLRKRTVRQMEEVPKKSRGPANKKSKKCSTPGDQKSSNDALSTPLNENFSTFTDQSSTFYESQFLALSNSKFSTPIVEDTSSSENGQNSHMENENHLTPTNGRSFDDSERDVKKLYERFEKQLELQFANQILKKLKPKVKFSYPSKNATKEDFFSMLNLQTPKSIVIKQESDLEPQISLQNIQLPPTPPTSAENTASNSKLSAISSLKQRSSPGSYIMKLKCHKTCFNSKVHNKKHKVDISSPMGQLLTKKDVIDDAYIQDSLKRIDQFTKTPVFDNKTNSFIHSKQNTKVTKTLKGKTGRKSGVSEVLAMMVESGTERNFMRKGSKVKTLVPMDVYVKREIC